MNKRPRYRGQFICQGDEKMVSMTVRMPKSTAIWIEVEAQKKGLSKTQMAREILIEQAVTSYQLPDKRC